LAIGIRLGSKPRTKSGKFADVLWRRHFAWSSAPRRKLKRWRLYGRRDHPSGLSAHLPGPSDVKLPATSTTPYYPACAGHPSTYALEPNAGTVKKLQLHPGPKVDKPRGAHERLATASERRSQPRRRRVENRARGRRALRNSRKGPNGDGCATRR
jgi:hypothetical protein